MRSEQEISAAAKDGSPFSNGTEGYAWMANWCDDCVHNDEETELWCPILTVALLGKTPSEWLEQPWQQIKGRPEGDVAPVLGDTYHCIEFRRRDDDDGPDGEPEPQGPGPFDEEMPGQTDIFTFIVEDALERLPEAVNA